jgi:hypothetical protein
VKKVSAKLQDKKWIKMSEKNLKQKEAKTTYDWEKISDSVLW